MIKSTALLTMTFALANLSAQADTLEAQSSRFVTPVVELYTSEGCNSCPPADRWLAELTRVPATDLNVLALAFHVDYWDYIGWKDPFADPHHTKRQRRLAHANNQSTIYTPGFFVDGLDTRGTGNIIKKIRQANRTPAGVRLKLQVEQINDRLALKLDDQSDSMRPLQVQFLVFENNLSSQVARGENAGRELHHQRVVRYLSRARSFSGDVGHEIPLDPDWKTNDLGVAALVASNKNAYLQSVFLDLPGR